MVDHFEAIYASQAGRYDQLVSREDYQQNILPALNKIRPLAGLEIVEMGAGTGRLTSLLSPLVKSIQAFDISQHMLEVAIAKLERTVLNNWTVRLGDNRCLPLEAQVADVCLAGWSFGHSTAWAAGSWRDEIGRAVAEMKRVLRPGGTAIILETMGTGWETPHAPNEALAAYYAWLEQELGFSYAWIRTDYQFESLAEAEELCRFFFGSELADRVVENNWVILPECTGIWWSTV